MSLVEDTADTLVLVFDEKLRKLERDLLLARTKLAAVREIDPADHATSSRDYGRGFAAAIKLVNDTLDGHQ